eukprot:UN28399
MMFQSRSYKFPIKSSCGVKLGYEWFLDPPTAPFVIEPSKGAIPAMQDELFHIRFNPQDAGTFNAKFTCKIPNLDKESSNIPEISLVGISQRPMLHFDLEPSDYLKTTSQQPPFTVDSNTSVIEFHSL